MPHFVKCNAPGVFNRINSRIFSNQNIHHSPPPPPPPPKLNFWPWKLNQGDQNQTCPRDIAMKFCWNSSTNIQEVSLCNVKIFPWVKDTKTLSAVWFVPADICKFCHNISNGSRDILVVREVSLWPSKWVWKKEMNFISNALSFRSYSLAICKYWCHCYLYK